MKQDATTPIPPPETNQNDQIRAEDTRRKGMSGRGNYGANKPSGSNINAGKGGKGAQHHTSNKAPKDAG